MYGVAGARCITAFGRMPVYSSIRFAVARMGAEIEARLEGEREEWRRWRGGCVCSRGETKGREQYTGADITAFICYVDTGTG